MTDRVSLSHFDELLTEDEVCRRFAALVGPRELRKARQNGEIAFVSGKKGALLYHPDALAEYLLRKESKCLKSSGNTGDIGLGALTAPPSSTHIGMTPEHEKLLVGHLERKFSKKPASGSSRSSDRPNQTGVVRLIA